MITDSSGIIEYANPAFEKQTGFTEEEALGKKPDIIKSGEHPAEFYNNIWKTILSGKTFRGCVLNKKKSGELYHEYKAIAPIKDKDENIIHFVSTGKDITERVLLEEKLEKLASTDRLTGVANRLRFDEHLKYAADRAKRYKIELSAILLDVDNFKKVNDTYGHVVGDYVLKTIAEIGTEKIRKSDIFARWGGEEFIVLQSDTPADQAIILAERLRKGIEDHPFENVGRVTASFGVTSFKQGDDITSFMVRVDEALYQAKENGKNRVEIK